MKAPPRLLHSATQFHPFSTLPWDDQYPLHHRAIDQSLREENRADRHFYIEAFDEIAAHGAFANSCDELAKRLARICRLADETDAKLTDLWFRHISPKTRNGIAHETMAEAQPDAAPGSNIESSDADEDDSAGSRDGGRL